MISLDLLHIFTANLTSKTRSLDHRNVCCRQAISCFVCPKFNPQMLCAYPFLDRCAVPYCILLYKMFCYFCILITVASVQVEELQFLKVRDILRYLKNFWRYLEIFWRHLELFSRISRKIFRPNLGISVSEPILRAIFVGKCPAPVPSTMVKCPPPSPSTNIQRVLVSIF